MNIPLIEIRKKLNSHSWDILELLNSKESLTYSEVQKKLGVGQAKISKELARLEGALLIESERNPMDSRVLYLRLTEYGLQILKLK